MAKDLSLKSNAVSDVTDPITAMLKMKAALAYLQNSDPVRLVIGPDAIRDGTIIVDDRQVFADETLGPKSKNRTSANAQVTIGGHGAIGAISAGTLRHDQNVEILLAAKVFKSTRDEVLETLIGNIISMKGSNPIDTDYVVTDPLPGTPLNIVFESPDHTSIAVVKGQPVLHTSDYGDRLDSLIQKIEDADVCGILSLKSPFMKEISAILHSRGIKPKELISDVTTGDDTSVMVDTLKLIGHGDHGSVAPPITLLSMNDEEAIRYAKIVWTMQQSPGVVESFLASEKYSEAKKAFSESVDKLSALEAQGRPEDELRQLRDVIRRCEDDIRECSKKFESGIAQDMEAVWDADPFKAAEYLAKNLKVPLFFHCAQGSQIFDSNNLERGTRFVSSVQLKPTAGTLGAGDTMLGAIMLAIGVKNRLDADEKVLPELRLSLEDCLMVANVVTGYRLVHGKVPGTMEECFRWASSQSAEATPAPAEWAGLEGAGKNAAQDAALVQKRMLLMKNARSEGFSGAAAEEVEKASPYLLKIFRQEGIRNSLPPEQAARELLPIIAGQDRVLSLLALNSLREIVKAQPSIREIIRKELGIGPTRLAVMFDLDATLFDSKASRERAGARAIMKMGLRMGPNNETPLDYESAKKIFVALYSCHDDFKKMGFTDFRHVWNTPKMYAAAAAIVRAGGKKGKTVESKEELSSLLDRFMKPGASPLLDENYAQLLANKINQVMNTGSYIQRINNAVQEYVKTGLVPYLDTHRTLLILKEILGAKIYVVTEGDDQTQKQKVEMLGLSELFGQGDRVLTSDYAKAPWREAAGLKIEGERLAKTHLASLEKLAAALQKVLELGKNHQNQGEAANANRALEAAKQELATYKEELKVFNWVNDMFTRKAQTRSGDATFYSEVLRAVIKSPDNPRDAMGTGDHIGMQPAPCFVIWCGDRADNDMAAMRKVSKEVIPIIIRKGAYTANYDEAVAALREIGGAVASGTSWGETTQLREKLDRLLNVSGCTSVADYEGYMPKLSADSLSDVARFLLSRQTYEGVQAVQPKKAQVERFGEEEFDNLLLGRLSPSKAVNLVCEDVLKAIAFGSEDDVCRAVGHFLPHLGSEHLEAEHPNRAPGQMKISAAENLAILLESCPNPTQKVAEAKRNAASKLADAFSNKAEDPSVRAQAVIAYGRISDDNGPISNLLDESAMELGPVLVSALTATSAKIEKTIRLKQSVAGEVQAAVQSTMQATLEISGRILLASRGADSYEMYKTAVLEILKDMAKYKGDPQLSGVRSHAALAYKAGKAKFNMK